MSRYAGFTCPGCGAMNDAATKIGEEREGAIGLAEPSAGDVGLCFRCGCLLVYTGTADVARRVTAEDEARLGPEQMAVLQRARQLVMDKNFIDERLHKFNGDPADVGRFAEQQQAQGNVPVLLGTRCADGPPAPRHRPARRQRCVKCQAQVWIKASAPTGIEAACPNCAAKLFQMLLRERS